MLPAAPSRRTSSDEELMRFGGKRFTGWNKPRPIEFRTAPPRKPA
jgi:hypothetical protein